MHCFNQFLDVLYTSNVEIPWKQENKHLKTHNPINHMEMITGAL